jgi:hypothetical protein
LVVESDELGARLVACTSPGQAGRTQGTGDWLAGLAVEPGRRGAICMAEPGSRGAICTAEPGSRGARVAVVSHRPGLLAALSLVHD